MGVQELFDQKKKKGMESSQLLMLVMNIWRFIIQYILMLCFIIKMFKV